MAGRVAVILDYGGQIVNVGCFVGSRLFVGMMTEGLIVKDITVFGNQHLTAGGGMCLDRQLADGVDLANFSESRRHISGLV